MSACQAETRAEGATTGAVLVPAHRGEARWAMVVTVLAAAGLHATLPAQIQFI